MSGKLQVQGNSTFEPPSATGIGLIGHPTDVYVDGPRTVTFTCTTSASSQLSEILWITEKVGKMTNPFCVAQFITKRNINHYMHHNL